MTKNHLCASSMFSECFVDKKARKKGQRVQKIFSSKIGVGLFSANIKEEYNCTHIAEVIGFFFGICSVNVNKYT